MGTFAKAWRWRSAHAGVGQVVVVVGASSGIGRATALAFARQGAKVVAGARSTIDALETLAAEAGGGVSAVPVDVADAVRVHPVRWRRCRTCARPAECSSGWARGVLPRGDPACSVHDEQFAVRAFNDTLRLELTEEGVLVSVTTILPPGVDTPLFEHDLRIDQAQAPPSVYSPEVVASAIVRAAEHPTREVPIGADAFGLLFAQWFSPALPDAVMAAGAFLSRLQPSDQADDGRDNLDAPRSGTGRTSGGYAGRVLQHSAFTRLLGHRSRPGDVLTKIERRLRRPS